MSRTKTYFITDSHLGSGSDSRRREADLVEWLGSIENEAGCVMMLGDIFDFWFSYKYVVPRGYVRLLGKMAQMADKGVQFHFFIGNHDMWMFDYLEKELGAIMHSKPEEMEIDGKLFLIGHGDGMGDGNRSYNFMKHFFRNRFCQWLFSTLHPRIAFGIARSWSEHSRNNHKVVESYKGDEREGIVQFCMKEQQKRKESHLREYDYFVFGHRHFPICRQLGDALYVNVGNWIDRRDYAVFDGERLEVGSFHPKPGSQER